MSYKFSIIIPTYNRANLIAKTLHSVLNQSFSDFEVIVVDDGSTDNTEAVMSNFVSPKVHYFKIPNGERAKARNFGVKKSQGNFVTFLDSDDLLMPHFFQEANDFLKKNPQAVFFSLGYQIISPEGKILHKINQRKGNLAQKLVTGNHLSCIAVFVKREIVLENPFNENRDLSGTEDYELWLRLASRYPLHYSNTIVASIVNHESRSVLSINEEKLLKRMFLLFECIERDSFCRNFYKISGIRSIKAHSWLYVALHLAMAQRKKMAFKYLLKAIYEQKKVIFNKKTFVILKKMLID
jgi:glycosyltransferase involved in cell wall biosynthesis